MRILELDTFKPTSKMPSPAQLTAWSKRLFSFAKARFLPPPLFHDSKAERLQRLRRFQHRFRNRTLFMLGVLGGLVLLGIFGWLAWAYRRDQIAMQHAVVEQDDESLEPIKTRGLPWLIGFLLILLMIFASIIYLFWAMKWTYDNL